MASPRKKRRISIPLIVVIVLLLAGGGFVAWKYFTGSSQSTGSSTRITTVAVRKGTLAATISASGTVRSRQTATVSWSTTGRIGLMNVKQGSQVKTGDVMASLDATSLTSSNAVLAQQDVITAQKALDDLQKSGVNKAQVQVALVNAQVAYDKALNDRAILDYSRGSSGGVKSAQAQVVIAQAQVESARDRLKFFDSKPDTDPGKASAQAALITAQQNLAARQASLNWYLGSPSATDIAEADAAVALAKAKLDDAQRTWDLAKNGPTADDIALAQAKVDLAKLNLNLSKLIAPFNGTVTDLKNQLGDLVSNGTNALRLDDLSSMYLDVTVSEMDVDQVAVGQKATITLDAVADKTYTGAVVDVDSVGATSGGTVNFTVTVKVDNPDPKIRPGMSAAVSIVLQQAENVLMVANRGIRTQNNNKYILVLKDGQMQRVNVKIGVSSDSETQVISDTLVEGDQVITNSLTELQQNNAGLLNILRVPGAGQVIRNEGGGTRFEGGVPPEGFQGGPGGTGGGTRPNQNPSGGSSGGTTP